MAGARSTTFEVRVASRAAQQVRQASIWWRSNRTDSPEALVEELEWAFSLLTTRPRIGVLVHDERLPNLRRLHLGRVRYHLYYRVFDAHQYVRILAFWHASRGAGPVLGRA